MKFRRYVLSLLLLLIAMSAPYAWGSKDEKKEAKRYGEIDIDAIKNDEQFAALFPEYVIRFTGLVEEERTWTFQDIIKAYGDRAETRTISGTRTDGEMIEIKYTGISLGELLDEVKIKVGVKNVIVYGTDNYSADLPLDAVEADDVYLVWKKDGKYMVPTQDGILKIVQAGGLTRKWVKNPVLFDFVSQFLDTVPLEDRLNAEEIDFVNQEQLFTLSIFNTVKIDAVAWRLEITGLIQNPGTYTYEDILAMPQETVYAVLETISNPPGGRSIGNAIWTGVPLGYVIDKVQPEDSVQEVVFKCEDGYSTSITLEEALQEGVLLCYRVNGETLLPQHGFPVRLVIPGKYGMKWAKWIHTIEFVDYDYKGYWERRGWSDYAGRDRPDERFD